MYVFSIPTLAITLSYVDIPVIPPVLFPKFIIFVFFIKILYMLPPLLRPIAPPTLLELLVVPCIIEFCNTTFPLIFVYEPPSTPPIFSPLPSTFTPSIIFCPLKERLFPHVSRNTSNIRVA